MHRSLAPLFFLPLVACLSTEDGGECVSTRRGLTEAQGTATIRFLATSECADDPADCWWPGCAAVAGGIPGEVACSFPVAGVGEARGRPPPGGCDVVAWDDRREPGDPLPTYAALRCAEPGPYLFFGLPDLRPLESDWPLSLPVAINAQPANADARACFNFHESDIASCSRGADPSHLDGLIELVSKTGGPGSGEPVGPDFRVSVRVDGHIPLRAGVVGVAQLPCTDVMGLDFRINLIQTAADYRHCEGE